MDGGEDLDAELADNVDVGGLEMDGEEGKSKI